MVKRRWRCYKKKTKTKTKQKQVDTSSSILPIKAMARLQCHTQKMYDFELLFDKISR